MSIIKDSGERRKFDSGAVRDCSEGKGRCDLLPLGVIGNVCSDGLLLTLHRFISTGDTAYLVTAFNHFAKIAFGDSIFDAILQLSIHYEDGCKKYGERNWEKGILCHCYVDSAIRHYLKYRRGDIDERHDRAFLWNIAGLLWTIENHPEYNDLPYKKKSDE